MASNYYDDVFKFTKELRNSFKLYEGMESVYKMTSSLKSIYKPFEPALKLGKSELIFAQEVKKMQKILTDTNTKKLLGLSEQLKPFSSIDISAMSKSMKEFSDTMQNIKNISDVSRVNDLQRLAKVMQESLNQVDWAQEISVDKITEEIAEQYIKDELKDNSSQTVSETQPKRLDKEKIKSEISFWLTLIGFILTLHGWVTSKPPVTNNTYNNIIEVNNNYTIELGIDADFMNEMGYRIINQNDTMPRIKPDCSSKVISHLYIGQVVNVSDKYKKWIEITWKNDEGVFCSGWIQNYKVSEFR